MYVVSQAGRDIENNKEPVYYCHDKNYPHIPVFGSMGNKRKANEICRLMNRDLKK